MKRIELSQDERKKLEDAMNSKQVTGRGLKRLQSVLFNARGHSMSAISDLLDVHYNSVGNWLRRFEQGGVAALEEKPREGRPRKLTEVQEAQVRTWVEQEPRQLKRVVAKVETRLDIKLSLDTLKRTLKRGATATGE